MRTFPSSGAMQGAEMDGPQVGVWLGSQSGKGAVQCAGDPEGLSRMSQLGSLLGAKSVHGKKLGRVVGRVKAQRLGKAHCAREAVSLPWARSHAHGAGRAVLGPSGAFP